MNYVLLVNATTVFFSENLFLVNDYALLAVHKHIVSIIL